MLDPNKIKKDFPIFRREINDRPLIYLDNAATSQKPKQVIEAIRHYYEGCNANVHRAVHTLSQEASELYENAHEEVADFINADGLEEIVFVRGTTEAINLVAYAWGLHNLTDKDEILVTLMDHHSNIVPWEMLSRTKRFQVKYTELNDDGTLKRESFEDNVSRNTKLVCVPHVSNVTGIINDIEYISKVTHENGALVFVDGAQSVPHLPIDVEDLDVDFLAFSGHKMLGPTGIGVLYGKKHFFKEMNPFQGGGSMITDVTFDPENRRCSISLNDIPWKLEAGTPNICGGVGLMAAIRYLKDLGMENVKAHEKMLTEYTLLRLEDCEKVKIYGPTDVSEKCGIIPFGIEGVSSHDIALFMDSYGIMIRSGFHCAQPLHERLGLKSSARASFYIYNTREEIDEFVQILKEIEQY
ncbi:MAG: cysteine desulfurase [Candidatus Bathyarchaeota archaeon]|jgi:cysteine desulfurase/selenocysteine lyase